MAKKPKQYRPTTRAMVRSAIRRYIWLRSRERGECVKRTKNTCERCGAKGSKAKGREVATEVHHKSGDTKLEESITIILDHLLCHPDGLELLCKSCHKDHHSGEKDE